MTAPRQQRRRVLGILVLATLGAGAWVWAARIPQDKSETIGFAHPLVTAAPALCPWRDPKHDLSAFFPGADRFETRQMALSGLRLPIRHRLGPGIPLENNSLSVFPIFRKDAPQGSVLVQRTAGEYGVIEVVVGVDTAGRVRGVKLQRLREPESIAAVLTDPAWLHAFRGKTADDLWRLGGDVPDRPAPARASARRIVLTLRSLLIEYDVVLKNADSKNAETGR